MKKHNSDIKESNFESEKLNKVLKEILEITKGINIAIKEDNIPKMSEFIDMRGKIINNDLFLLYSSGSLNFSIESYDLFDEIIRVNSENMEILNHKKDSVLNSILSLYNAKEISKYN
jgi:hypothetical protein